jgi:hypothetical protein
MWNLNLASILLVVLSVAWPVAVPAAGAADHAVALQSAQAASQVDSLTGAIVAQAGSLNGQVTLGRDSAAVNAQLADTGPEGQRPLAVGPSR